MQRYTLSTLYIPCMCTYMTWYTCTYFHLMIRFQLHPPGWPAWKLQISCCHGATLLTQGMLFQAQSRLLPSIFPAAAPHAGAGFIGDAAASIEGPHQRLARPVRLLARPARRQASRPARRYSWAAAVGCRGLRRWGAWSGVCRPTSGWHLHLQNAFVVRNQGQAQFVMEFCKKNWSNSWRAKVSHRSACCVVLSFWMAVTESMMRQWTSLLRNRRGRNIWCRQVIGWIEGR